MSVPLQHRHGQRSSFMRHIGPDQLLSQCRRLGNVDNLPDLFQLLVGLQPILDVAATYRLLELPV